MSKDFRTRIFFIVAILATFLFYFVLNRSLTPKFVFETYVDNLIPFTPFFGLFYSSYLIYLALWVGYFALNFPLHRFRQFSIAFLSVQILAFIAYVVIPSKILRPPVGPGVMEDIVRVIYYIDNPTNLTPSLHVANSLLVALFMLKSKTLRLLICSWALMIVLSTMAVKQHYVVDVVSGIVLATSVYYAVRKYGGNDE